MYTRFAVIQKLDASPQVKVYLGKSEFLRWAFEHRRGMSDSDREDIFPFLVDSNVNIAETRPGAETCIYKQKNGDITFEDDYDVPGSFVICILSPTGYLPFMIKLREKTSIPIVVPNYQENTPGFIQLYSNRITQQSAVILNISENSAFSITVDFARKEGEFPTNL